jgi:hypothetical protein
VGAASAPSLPLGEAVVGYSWLQWRRSGSDRCGTLSYSRLIRLWGASTFPVRNELAAVIVGVLLALSGTAVARAPSHPAAAVRQTWVAWTRAVFTGDPRGCARLDGRFRRQFVGAERRNYRAAIRDCADALRLMSTLIQETRSPLASQLRLIARARINVQGKRATLTDATDTVVFVKTSGRWLIDGWPRG